MNERLDLLAAMPVFGGLNAATLELITRLAQHVTVKQGGHFFRQDDETHAMYVLQTGRVEIYRMWNSTPKVLRCLNAGDCFGEMALIDLFPRSASALAVEPSEAMQITPQILHQIYQQDIEQFTLMQMNMAREISRRMRRVDELLFNVLMGDTLSETTFTDLS